MKIILRLLQIVLTALIGFGSPALSQKACANTPDYFAPLTSGDGQRYPLTIGPLVWHLLGSGVYPVKGSDGLTHLAFGMQFTNVWDVPATIASVEVVDPAKDDRPTGTNHVLSAKDEDVTGLLKLTSLPPTQDKASYSSKLASGAYGVMFFDVIYADSNDVPCPIALRLPSLQPDSKAMPESTLLSPPLKVSSQTAIVLAPP